MIKLLPLWVLTNKRSAFYDSESGTALEQTARVYGKMQELIEDYNKFATEVNKAITDYATDLDSSFDCFKTCITDLVENYIKSIDMKIDKQDMVIDNAVKYMVDNLKPTIYTFMQELKASGELDGYILDGFDNLSTRVATLESTEYTLVHDPETEELVLIKSVGGV